MVYVIQRTLPCASRNWRGVTANKSSAEAPPHRGPGRRQRPASDSAEAPSPKRACAAELDTSTAAADAAEIPDTANVALTPVAMASLAAVSPQAAAPPPAGGRQAQVTDFMGQRKPRADGSGAHPAAKASRKQSAPKRKSGGQAAKPQRRGRGDSAGSSGKVRSDLRYLHTLRNEDVRSLQGLL